MFITIQLNKKLISLLILIVGIIFFSYYLLTNERLQPSYTPNMEFRVAVDPGHGSIDTGTSYGNIYEKDINLEIAKFLEKELKKTNIIPIMTRTEDKLYHNSRIDDIRYRPKFAREQNANLFISIHVNNFPSSYPCGSQIFYKPGSDTSKKLAEKIQSELVKLRSKNNRVFKSGDYYVLKKVSCPAVLIETGFLSNAEDRRKLTSNDYQKKLAIAIKEGIINYFRSQMNTKKNTIFDHKINKNNQNKDTNHYPALSVYYFALDKKNLNLVRSNFSYPAGTILQDKFKNLKYNEILVKIVLEQLINDPPANLISIFPPDTSVKSVNINEGTAIIDFSPQLQSNFNGGARRELLFYRALTKTLFSFPGITELEILINGKKQQSIGGHIILDKIYKNNQK